MRTFKELLDQLYEVQGVPFIELAEAHDIDWHDEPERNKWVSGQIVEAAMGKAADSRPQPDLTELSLEVKSIPIAEGLEPHEHTKVTMLNFQNVVDNEWDDSRVYHKVRSILFVPIVKYNKDRPDQWYIRSPFVWMPSTGVMEQMKTDYEEVRRRLRDGKVDEITASHPKRGGFCLHLIPNTAGRDSSDTTTYEVDGETYESKRRAWMLRKDLTHRILKENIKYRPPPIQDDQD